MRKIVLIATLLLISTQLEAQITVPEPPFEDRGFKYTQLDSGSTLTRNFYFNKSGGRSGYSGYDVIYVHTDSATTATQTVATYDSLHVDAYALEWDEPNETWKICQTGLCVSGGDSINVANWIDWGTGHSDSKFTVSKVLNFQPCDGIRIVAQAKSDVLTRFEHKYAKQD